MVFTVVEIFWSSETGRDSDKPLFILTGPRRGGAGFVGEFFNHHSGSDLQATQTHAKSFTNQKSRLMNDK